MLIHPIQSTELYPIGSIVEASNPPDNKWVPCNGQVLAQADYPVLYNLMEQPHSIFQNFEVVQDTDLDEMYEVVYGNGLFVGCGDGEMFYSSDGLSWTKVVLPTYTNTFYGIAYDGTTFVSVGYDDGEYVTSTDGQNWTERLLPVTWSVTNITYSGTYFFIIGNTCLRSSNGTSWTEYTSLTTIPDAFSASPDVVVGFGWGGDFAFSDDDGVTWSEYNSALTSVYTSYYDSTDDIFVASDSLRAGYAISPGDDGMNWESFHFPIGRQGSGRSFYHYTASIYRIRKAGDYYFAVPQGGNEHQIGYSSDLKTWDTFPCLEADWYEVYYNSSSEYYYMMGYGPTFMRWKADIDYYNTGTHFKLPLVNSQHDWYNAIKRRKYIRVI